MNNKYLPFCCGDRAGPENTEGKLLLFKVAFSYSVLSTSPSYNPESLTKVKNAQILQKLERNKGF